MEEQDDRMRAFTGCEIEDGIEPRAVTDDVRRFHRRRKIFVTRRIGGDRRRRLLSPRNGGERKHEGCGCGEAKQFCRTHGATLCRISWGDALEKFAAFGTSVHYERQGFRATRIR